LGQQLFFSSSVHPEPHKTEAMVGTQSTTTKANLIKHLLGKYQLKASCWIVCLFLSLLFSLTRMMDTFHSRETSADKQDGKLMTQPDPSIKC